MDSYLPIISAVLLFSSYVAYGFVRKRGVFGSKTSMASPAKTISTADFNLASYLKEKKVKVEAALEVSLKAESPHVDKIIESMKYSLMAGGKRIRPILCLAACELFGGSEASAMPVAVALEMIHTMSLIHDDLPSMDNDDLRRGKPTNHVLYGEDVATLAGDALLSTSFEHVATHTKGVPAERVVEILRRLGTSVGPNGLAGGQVMDLQCEGRSDVTLAELEWIHMHKTASLLRVSVAAGAIIAGAGKEDIAACELFAEKIGLAFQITDDILDVTSTSAELGKTAGKDQQANKATYVRLLGLEQSQREAQRIIDEAKASIAVFGDRAVPLMAIADYILSRRN